MNPLQSIVKQFHFTKVERHGAAALLLFAGVSLMAPELYRWQYSPPEADFSKFAALVKASRTGIYFEGNTSADEKEAGLFAFDPNTATVETLVQLGLSEKVARSIDKYRNKGGRFRSGSDLQKIYVLSEADYERLLPFVQIKTAAASVERPGSQESIPKVAEISLFDPNTASEQELLRLGLPKSLVGRLLHYREKGGVFFDKPDFKKLYGLSDADYSRLEPFIDIRREARAVRPQTYSSVTNKPEKHVDINTATPEEWQQLPGIGAFRAQKIVRFRDKLGGFVCIEQVGETKGLPDSIFQIIRSGLQLETPVFRKINLNTATLGEIGGHPYFSLRQAQLIIAYREQRGGFRDVEEMGRIQAFTDKQWLERVKPYLKAE